MDNDSIRFTARFGRVSHPVTVPISAVLAIYARETGQGIALPADIGGSGEPAEPGEAAPADAADPSVGGPDDDDPPPPRSRHLRVVKTPPSVQEPPGPLHRPTPPPHP